MSKERTDQQEQMQTVVPWGKWRARACESGVADQLAVLGTSVMREAAQSDWGEKLREECGWRDEGARMIERALADPEAAHNRWEQLLSTNGEQSDH
jgi:hypothetical protein